MNHFATTNMRSRRARSPTPGANRRCSSRRISPRHWRATPWRMKRRRSFGGCARVRRAFANMPGFKELSGTGNIHSGRMIVEYALRGCSSVQLHTFFQLPLEEYPATEGSRTQRALHALIFEPRDGLIAVMREREVAGLLERSGGELRFLDLVPEQTH